MIEKFDEFWARLKKEDVDEKVRMCSILGYSEVSQLFFFKYKLVYFWV